MIGVSYGPSTEFRCRESSTPEDTLPERDHNMVADSIRQDDLYADMTFAQVLDNNGLDATAENFGAMFRYSKYHLWHGNLAARRVPIRGVPATLRGTPEYNAHANDIDFQIEADLLGLMTPGLPQASNDLIVDRTEKRAVAMAGRNGGHLESDQLIVKAQDAVSAKLEVWDDYREPVERVPVSDPRGSWKGDWADSHPNCGSWHAVRTSASRGVEASIEFEGTGAIIWVFHLQTGAGRTYTLMAS